MFTLKILLGFFLLFAGQKLFWLLVAGVGFLATFNVAAIFCIDMPEWKTFAIGIICGLLGIFFAFFLQNIAVASAGFAAGIYICLRASIFFTSAPYERLWPFLLLGGFLGSVLSFIFFRPALIVISSLVGAILIVEDLALEQNVKLLLVAFLFFIGIFFQIRFLNISPAKTINKK